MVISRLLGVIGEGRTVLVDQISVDSFKTIHLGSRRYFITSFTLITYLLRHLQLFPKMDIYMSEDLTVGYIAFLRRGS